MKIDNDPVIPDRAPEPVEAEFWTRLIAIVVKELDMEYADIVHAYRQLEADILPRIGDDAVKIVEVKRHIAEYILTAARDQGQPFEVCRDAWNALVELGFSNIQTLCLRAWCYADCCLFNAHYDAGIEVLDMVIAEIHRRLEAPGLTRQTEKYFDQELTGIGGLREGLVAHKSSEAEGKAWNDRKDAEDDAREVHYMEREGRDRELHLELSTAMDTIAHAAWRRGLAETTRDYRQLETDFVARLQGSDEFFIPETRRRIHFAILMDAHKHKQPFDVCRDAWKELVRGDFTDILQKCAMAWFYADCCLFNKESDAGLAVIEPLIAELRKQLDEDTDAETSECCQAGLARLQKLRDELKAIPR